MALFEGGANVELDEDANGNTVLRNTLTGTEITLAELIEIGGSLDLQQGDIQNVGSLSTNELSNIVYFANPEEDAQAALDAADEANLSIISFPAATYGTDSLSPYEGQTIIGSGRGTKISSTGSNAIVVSNPDVTVKNLSVEGGTDDAIRSDTGGDRLSLKSVWVEGAGRWGILTRDNTLVQSCRIFDCGDNEVNIVGDNAIISNNWIYGVVNDNGTGTLPQPLGDYNQIL